MSVATRSIASCTSSRSPFPSELDGSGRFVRRGSRFGVVETVADFPFRSLDDWFMPASRVPARRPGNFGVRITSLREVSGPPLREHLLAQMKVTRPPGRDPACRHEPIIERTKWKARNGPPPDR